MTKAQILKFIRIRNKSRFSSNLQFQIDLDEAGIDLGDLPEAKRRDDGGYEWATPHGLLVEHPGGRMELLAA